MPGAVPPPPGAPNLARGTSSPCGAPTDCGAHYTTGVVSRPQSAAGSRETTGQLFRQKYWQVRQVQKNRRISTLLRPCRRVSPTLRRNRGRMETAFIPAHSPRGSLPPRAQFHAPPERREANDPRFGRRCAPTVGPEMVSLPGARGNATASGAISPSPSRGSPRSGADRRTIIPSCVVYTTTASGKSRAMGWPPRLRCPPTAFATA